MYFEFSSVAVAEELNDDGSFSMQAQRLWTEGGVTQTSEVFTECRELLLYMWETF